MIIGRKCIETLRAISNDLIRDGIDVQLVGDQPQIFLLCLIIWILTNLWVFCEGKGKVMQRMVFTHSLSEDNESALEFIFLNICLLQSSSELWFL